MDENLALKSNFIEKFVFNEVKKAWDILFYQNQIRSQDHGNVNYHLKN